MARFIKSFLDSTGGSQQGGSNVKSDQYMKE